MQEEQKILQQFKKLKSNSKGVHKFNKEMFHVLCEYGAKVAASSIAEHPKTFEANTSTAKRIAIVSDGSHVPGLGNVGSVSVVPVLEGQTLLMRELVSIETIPIILESQDTKEITKTLSNIANTFAGFIFESIAAPKCFDIEEALRDGTNVPIFQNSKDGVAIATLAALINAHKLLKKNIRNTRVAILGAGATGIGIAKLLTKYGIGDVVVVDKDGIISTLRTNISGEKEALAQYTNKEGRTGGALEAITGADVLISTIKTGLSSVELIRMMAQKPIVFALAEPLPEITPKEANGAGAYIVATGHIHYPNHISSALVTPGVCRGITQHACKHITSDMKITIAERLAELVSSPTVKKLLPTIFDRRVSKSISDVFKK